MTAQEIRAKALECAVATVNAFCHTRDAKYSVGSPRETKDETLKIASEYADYIAGNDMNDYGLDG